MKITTRLTISIETGEVLEHEFYEYDGAVALACGGAPSGQTALADAQTQMYQTQTNDMNQLFAQDEALNNEIQSVYGPIFKAGPSQLGFSQGELNTLNSGASTGVGQSFAAANSALKENLASAGGGDIQLPSGAMTKAEEGMTTAGAAQLAGEENQIQQADYAQGLSNFDAATNALLGVGSVFSNSIAMGGVANQGGEAANQTYNAIAQENESPFAAVMGALGGVASGAGAAFGGYETGHCWLAAACFNEDFYTGHKTGIVRQWLWTIAIKKWYAKPLLWLYARYSKKLAALPKVVEFFTPLFNKIYEVAR